jgi:hypothetical protein
MCDWGARRFSLSLRWSRHSCRCAIVMITPLRFRRLLAGVCACLRATVSAAVFVRGEMVRCNMRGDRRRCTDVDQGAAMTAQRISFNIRVA